MSWPEPRGVTGSAATADGPPPKLWLAAVPVELARWWASWPAAVRAAAALTVPKPTFWS
jgi:hypothetical protein